MHLGALTDEQLMVASLEDPEAFGELYDRHSRLVFAHLRRRTGSPEVAADLTAEVFAAALVARSRFVPGPAPLIAWLLAIANNKLADSRRRGRVEDRARRRVAMEPRDFNDEQLERAEALIDLADQHQRLWAAVAALPGDQRAAVLAHLVDEVDYADLACVWNVSQAVVRKRVSRGLRRLASAMGDAQ